MAGSPKLLTDAELFYSSKDVGEILGYSQAQGYKIIRALNEELRAKGYIVRPGKIPKAYFMQRYCLEV